MSDMIGLNGKTHYELEQFIDMESFDQIQIEILKGLAIAKPLAQNGILHNPIDVAETSYKPNFKPLFQAYKEFQKLPVDNPIRIAGEELQTTYGENTLSTFLKFAYKAHDLCSFYSLWSSDPGWKKTPQTRNLTEISVYFPSLLTWIDNLVTSKVFSHIGRVYIVTQDSGGVSFEHQDPPSDTETNITEEFIHVRPNLARPFYVYNPSTNKKFYIESRVGWWNDKDIHGGEPSIEPSYALRVDGIFTKEFKKKIGIE